MAKTYGQMELDHVGSVGPGDTVKIKIVGREGATRWISIDAEMFARIAEIVAERD